LTKYPFAKPCTYQTRITSGAAKRKKVIV